MRIALTKENQSALKDKLKELANTRLRDKKQELFYVEDDIKRSANNLRVYIEKRKRISDDIIREELNNDNVADKLMSVVTLDKVKEAYYETESKVIVVITNPLYFRTLNGGRYYLGGAVIKYNTTNFGIAFDTSNHRRSYWNGNCPHPHVNSNGDACLGNTAELIASLQAEGEYGLIFEVLIAFLEQANTDDCAGRHAMNWDKVDEEGNVIQEGFMNYDGARFKYGSTPEGDRVIGEKVCACCGEAIDEDDEDARTVNGEEICGDCIEEHYRYCNVCNEWHDADDCDYYDELEMYVCDACLDENYRKCDVCGNYYHLDYGNYVESTEQNVCDHCLENKFTYCDDCQEYHPIGEVVWVGSANKDVCRECLEAHYTLCASCDEYFFTEEMTHDGADDVYLCTDCYEEKYADADEEITADEEEEDAFPFDPELALPSVTKCNACGDIINLDEAVIYDNKTFCVPCAVDKL